MGNVNTLAIKYVFIFNVIHMQIRYAQYTFYIDDEMISTG